MDSYFYREFEKHYRGSRELIKFRLQIYLSVIEPIKDFDSELLAIDLGCGRGEWIELINETGFNAYGVDIDDGMLADCYERGLPAKKQDAIDFIQTLDSDSHVIVSAFHVVEHVRFEQLQVLVREALRVLRPGGLLIMETPNPENITVAAKNFYLDPTHKKPIPFELLSFLSEYYGFNKVKVLRLQESKELAAGTGASLYAVISGASPDYAVVAQKNASTEILSRFDHVLDKDYGLSLETLAKRHDDQIFWHIDQVGQRAQKAEQTAESAQNLAQETETKAQKAEDTSIQAESKAQKAEQTAENAQSLAQEADTKAQKAEDISSQAESKAQKAEQTAENAQSLAQEADTKAQKAEQTTENAQNLAKAAETIAQKAEDTAIHAESKAQHAQMLAEAAQAQAHQFHAQLNAVYNSYSWRVTWPLRKTVDIARWSVNLPMRLIKWMIRLPGNLVARLMSFAIKRESLRVKLLERVNKHPWLKARLTSIGQNRGVLPEDNFPENENTLLVSQNYNQSFNEQEADLENMTPRARQIYHDLKKAIEQRQKERV